MNSQVFCLERAYADLVNKFLENFQVVLDEGVHVRHGSLFEEGTTRQVFERV